MLLGEAEIPKLKANDVLVKIHAVSLQVCHQQLPEYKRGSVEYLHSTAISWLQAAYTGPGMLSK